MALRIPRLSRRSQIIVVALMAILVGAVAAGAATLKHFFSSGESRAAAGPTAAPAPGTFRPTKEQWAGLKVFPVESYTFRTEQITDGNIAINDDTTTPVFSPYSGRVTKVIAKLGDEVKQGDPLMAVEASEVVQAQNDLVASLSALNTARGQLKLAEGNEKRQHDLYLAKSGALKDWLQSQADLTGAQNALRSAETARAAARNKLRILGKSAAEVAAVENNPNMQQMNPEAIVRAPIAGTVVQRQVGLGQYIASAASGATTNPVYSIGDLSTVWLMANVRETDARLVRVGQRVDVRVLAYPGRVFNAEITWIAPSIDPTTRRLPVRAQVDNTDRALKPQMFASFSIITGTDVAAPAIPQSAVIYEGEKAHVWVALEDGTVASRNIKVGRTNDTLVEVTEGLRAGERIIASGTLFIDRAAQVKD